MTRHQIRPQNAKCTSEFIKIMGIIALIAILIASSGCQLIPEYRCGANIYDCKDFKSHKEAQKVFEYCGPKDIHNLDLDDDGLACEDY